MEPQSVDNLILFNIFGRKNKLSKLFDLSRNSLQTGEGFVILRKWTTLNLEQSFLVPRILMI